jgi:hypothetical protein
MMYGTGVGMLYGTWVIMMYVVGIVGNVTTLTLNANMELTYSVTVAMSMVTRLKCVRYTRYMVMVIVL